MMVQPDLVPTIDATQAHQEPTEESLVDVPEEKRLNAQVRVLKIVHEDTASDSSLPPRATERSRPAGTSWLRSLLPSSETPEVMRLTFPSPRIRRRALRAAQSALHLSGAAAAFVRAREVQGAMILVYHAIVTDEEARWFDPRYTISISTFEAQMRYLSRYRRVVAMGTLMDKLDKGEAIPPGTVAITFDDGYLSTLTRAIPILKRYDLPAVTYLPTGYISRAESQFADVLFTAFNFRTRNELTFPEDILGHARLVEREPIRWAYGALEHALMVATYEDRKLLLAEILDQLRPSCLPPRLTLNWDEVALMRSSHRGMELGLHTHDHIDLSSRTSTAAEREIEACLLEADEHLDEPIHHFSYPFGRAHAAARAAVERAGLRTGALTEPPALVRNGVDRFTLPRLNAPQDMQRFPFFTGGAYPELSLAILRRA